MFLLHLQHLSLHHPHYLLCLGVDACRLALLLVALHQHVHHMHDAGTMAHLHRRCGQWGQLLVFAHARPW